MLWLSNIIVCYGREDDYIPSNLPLFAIDASTDYWDMTDGGKLARESTLEEEQDKPGTGCLQKFTCKWNQMAPIAAMRTASIVWDSNVPLRAQFSVLDDWATALHAYHIQGVVHGNLTPRSVGVVHGKGTLKSPSQAQFMNRRVFWAREHPDDVYAARWAASELFDIENSNPSPSKMSDVYSFACLMLQLLTGEVPYCGTKRPEHVVYLKYLGREPIDTKTPKVVDHHVAFLRRCWSPDPENRPAMETVVNFIHEEIKKLGEQHS